MVLTGIPFIDCIILFHMIFFSYFANNPAWISGSQTIWRNIPCHNTSCSYYTSLSYGNTTTNNHIGCQPAIIFYSNWRESEGKKLWETNSRRSEIYKESISFLIWHLKDSQCPLKVLSSDRFWHIPYTKYILFRFSVFWSYRLYQHSSDKLFYIFHMKYTSLCHT